MRIMGVKLLGPCGEDSGDGDVATEKCSPRSRIAQSRGYIA